MRKGRLAQFALKILPAVGLGEGRLFGDPATVEPFLETAEVDAFHGAGTFAGGE